LRDYDFEQKPVDPDVDDRIDLLPQEEDDFGLILEEDYEYDSI